MLGAELFVTWVPPNSWIKAQNPKSLRGQGRPPGTSSLIPSCGSAGGREKGGREGGWELGGRSRGPPRRMDVTVTAGPACIRWSGAVAGRQDRDQGQTEGLEGGVQGPWGFLCSLSTDTWSWGSLAQPSTPSLCAGGPRPGEGVQNTQHDFTGPRLARGSHPDPCTCTPDPPPGAVCGVLASIWNPSPGHTQPPGLSTGQLPTDVHTASRQGLHLPTLFPSAHAHVCRRAGGRGAHGCLAPTSPPALTAGHAAVSASRIQF